jgi:2'-5' RNA ligase
VSDNLDQIDSENAANNSGNSENQSEPRKEPRKRMPTTGGEASTNQNSGGGFRREGQSSGGGYRGGNSGGGGYRGNSNGGSGGGYRKDGGRNPRGKQGGKPTRREMDMYYVTLLCPLDIDEQVHEHKNYMRRTFGCDVASKSPSHITLIAPFFMSGGKSKELEERLEAFESTVNEVSLNLNGYGHFENRVIFVDVEPSAALETLQEQLEVYLKNNGFPFIKEAKKPFHPHVTIATRDVKPEDFEAAWPTFEGKEFTASFTTNTMHLMKLSEDRWIHEKQFVLK